MTTTSHDPRVGERPAPITFDSFDPATGEIVGTHPVHDAESVNAAVVRARAAAAFWSSLTFPDRARRLTTWAAVLTRRIGQLAELVHAETGKPHPTHTWRSSWRSSTSPGRPNTHPRYSAPDAPHRAC